MTEIDNRIKNIYYMLCYCFDTKLLTEREIASLSTEPFKNIYDLFSIILVKMVRKQIKKGINREYINKQDDLNFVKGKIDLTKTISTGSIVRKRIICNFDEFSENNILNQIIKTTLFYLLNTNKIGKQTKKELNKTLVYLKNINLIDTNKIDWNILNFNRNNREYRNILLICKLLLENIIVSNKKGNKQFKQFIDEIKLKKMLYNIYENFVKAYFKKHYKNDFKTKSTKLFLTKTHEEYIGIMKTDIVLESKNTILIIDTKFYTNILTSNIIEKNKIVSNANIYQINTYVESQILKNKEEHINKKVQGMLLYAQTTHDPVIDKKYLINQKEIFIKTLDLNKEWQNIKNTLDNIAKSFINTNIN